MSLAREWVGGMIRSGGGYGDGVDDECTDLSVVLPMSGYEIVRSKLGQ